jgi:hypothetical protein
MGESYLDLKKRNQELTDELAKLNLNYSENTVIQSMNSMKEIYEEKERELNLLENKFIKSDISNIYLVENIRAIKLMINVIIKNIDKIEILNRYSYESETQNCLNILQSNLVFVNSLIDETLKKNNEQFNN